MVVSSPLQLPVFTRCSLDDGVRDGARRHHQAWFATIRQLPGADPTLIDVLLRRGEFRVSNVTIITKRSMIKLALRPACGLSS